ncbi:MAG: DUF3014 domain-containing protein [Gammaproteobacteria bacterium]|nr:DUF3014 domain-containing protein [Gammaproteobacteria bacterium]
MRISFIIGAVLIAAIGIFVFQQWPHWFPAEVPSKMTRAQAQQPSSSQPPLVLPAASTPMTSKGDAMDTGEATVLRPEPLPQLDQSDEFVRQRIADWSLPAAWSARPDLLSRLAVIILNTADGSIARRQLGYLAPKSKFQVEKVGELTFIHPQSYARYDVLVAALTSVPPEAAARLLQHLSPLLQQALARLGDHRKVDLVVAQGLDRISQLPEVSGSVEVLQPKVMYTYADEKLEAMPEFEKQMLRFGVQNIRKLKTYVQVFKAQLASL